MLNAGQTPLFVSHYWDLSTSSQELCAQRLSTAYGDLRPRHVRARVGFDSNDFSHEMAAESTSRGRSFLFFALATLAASGIEGTPTIYVPENGLIALNVPLDPLRVGAWSTRTTHPFYMALWQALLGQLGIAARLKNPYRFKTKGEMLSECGNPALVSRHVGETISCSSIAKARWQGLSPQQCGFCVPCLIRRAAIVSAFPTDPTTYTIADLRAEPRNSRSPQGEHIRAFQMMARRLSRRPELTRILIRKSGPLSDYPDGEIAQYADVFRARHRRGRSHNRPCDRSTPVIERLPVRGFDLHCHVDLFPDPATLIATCDKDQIVTLAVTTTPLAWTQNQRWTAGSRYVHIAVGLHPELVGQRHSEIALLEVALEESPFIGEIGLDGSSQYRGSWERQKQAFVCALSVAQRLGGRVASVHSRRAAADVVRYIEEHTTADRVLTILHWFSGSRTNRRTSAASRVLFLRESPHAHQRSRESTDPQTAIR